MGGGAFVSQILAETGLAIKCRLANLDRERAAKELVEQCCHDNGVSRHALSGGSRVRSISRLRGGTGM